jgi:hypothetical protein
VPRRTGGGKKQRLRIGSSFDQIINNERALFGGRPQQEAQALEGRSWREVARRNTAIDGVVLMWSR